jgi:hypothetical protein
MDESFKSLPPQFFRDLKSTDADESRPGVLWLPSMSKSPATQKLDWLTGLQVSSLTYSKGKKWSPEMKSQIEQLSLPLDESPPILEKGTLLFSLPPGFKSRLGLIVSTCKWATRQEVYETYMPICEAMDILTGIQSVDVWSSAELPEEIEWIKA